MAGLSTELMATPPLGVEAWVSADSIAIEDEVVMMGSGRTKTIFSEDLAAVCEKETAENNNAQMGSAALK
jgi:hypothetical protein